MLYCDRFRWVLLPLIAGTMLVTSPAAQADVVILYNGSLSIGVGSLDAVPGILPDRHPFYNSNYGYDYPQTVYTNRIEDSTLINPVVIGVPIEDSTLINPVIVSPSRLDREALPERYRRSIVRPDLGLPRNDNPSCTLFVSLRPACW